MLSISLATFGIVHASGSCCAQYSLNSVPAATQEGNSVSLILTVSSFSSTISTTYSFRFTVTAPSGTLYQSQLVNYTTVPGQDQFTILVAFPSPTFPGMDSNVGKYAASVDQLTPVAALGVATSSFVVSLTDAAVYQRTQTVSIQASGYNASEAVTVDIRAQTTSTLVYSQQLPASSSGVVATSWSIPVNASIDTYDLSITGSGTIKNPSDFQRFSVNTAIMTIASIVSSKTIYQKTETMKFSFQPKYPDGSSSSTGVGLLNLMDPNRNNQTLTATYDATTQTFNASFTTTAGSQTGAWIASLSSHSYSDAYGNTGPGTRVSTAPQLAPATLSVNVATGTNFVVGQQARFNASVTFPDGTALTSGTVRAYFLYSGTPVINDSIPLVFDTGLGLWIGTYTPQPSDTGGLWSLVFKASDSSSPPDSGSATRAITLQNNNNPSSGSSASLPLYFFGIIAALIAGLLIATFLAFRRRKETHARLKIDLEAVRSEAGRIENQDFFKSIKDQVTKADDQE